MGLSRGAKEPGTGTGFLGLGSVDPKLMSMLRSQESRPKTSICVLWSLVVHVQVTSTQIIYVNLEDFSY